MTSILEANEAQVGKDQIVKGTVLHTRVVTGTGGGPDKTILNSPRFLQPLGYKSLCAYLHPPQDEGIASLRARAEENACPFFSVPDGGPLDFSVVRGLLKICKTHSVTIWHGHDYKTNALGLVLRRFHKMKLVTTVHGWVHYTSRTPLYYWIDRQCLKHYDHVIAVSDDLYDECNKNGVKEPKSSLIWNAIDTDQFKRHDDRIHAKDRLGFAEDRFLIGAIGRLAEEKGFGLLIEAVDRLIQSGLNVELAIVGEGDDRGKLEDQIRATSHPDRFHLLGFRSDTIELYHAMDLFVLSSLREGLPNVLLEAMAIEVPVIATRIAGVPKLVVDEQNGVLIEPDSVEQIRNAIERLFHQPDTRDSLAQNGRKTIEDKFSFEKRMEKIRDVYDSFLDE